MNILEASFMGVGLAMDALAVSLTLGAVGWSCPKTQNSASSDCPGKRPWFRRLPFLSPTPAAPVCAVCHPYSPYSCRCAEIPASGCAFFTWDKILLTALLFGTFQAGMPTIGWFGSGLCGGLVQKLGRIAAGLLLAVVAAQMLREGFSKEKDPAKKIGVCSLRRLIVLSFATSIDALLVGVSYACLGRTNIAGDARRLQDFVIKMKDICGSQSELKFGGYDKEKEVNLNPNVMKTKEIVKQLSEWRFEEVLMQMK